MVFITCYIAKHADSIHPVFDAPFSLTLPQRNHHRMNSKYAALLTRSPEPDNEREAGLHIIHIHQPVVPKNIATGETSQVITSFDYYNFHH